MLVLETQDIKKLEELGFLQVPNGVVFPIGQDGIAYLFVNLVEDESRAVKLYITNDDQYPNYRYLDNDYSLIALSDLLKKGVIRNV